MRTMKAAVFRNFGSPLAIEDVPVPQPGPGEVLVKVEACPVKPVPPFIPGHEAAGIIAALGSGVSGLKIGDAVGVAWLHDACLRCDM
jgi:alcohol dehydrogenase, propanol-preferring